MFDFVIVMLGPGIDLRLKFDEKELVDFLFSVYLKMFSDETKEAVLQSAWSSETPRIDYVRFSFVYFLRLVKNKVDVDWPLLMGQLYELIANDNSLMVGSNNPQDLEGTPSSRKGKVSLTVCITFLVPNFKFQPILDLAPDEVGDLTFIISIIGCGYHACFQHYQSYFGDFSTVVYPDNDHHQEPTISSMEYSKGWQSTSPAILSFYIPT
ncbi:hypothetical protein AX15_007415 [Amanita polypyramis BW_CC]|nr:hypothetical protein AX15_007415 [Amanita polypyramis BW_CC]